MALSYALSAKDSEMENSTDLRVSYTCTVTDELGAELASETVSGIVNASSPLAQTSIAEQIGTAINQLLDRTALWRAKDAEITDGLIDLIAAQLGG